MTRPTLPAVRNAISKLRWGIRVVGVGPPVVGVGRLIAMRLRRAPSVLVRLKSGPELQMTYPRQLVPALVVFGDYIDPEFDFVRRIARSDWIVVDVGAAIGQFSVFAARLPTRQVYAFEPSGENVSTLTHNLARNGVDAHVTIMHMALSHDNSTMSFPTLGNPYLSRPDHADGAVGTESVPVRTLTRALTELGVDHVDCLKINVAGFESEVLQGAEDFFARQGADVLIVLISPGARPWFSKLAAHHYRFFFFHPRERQLYEIPDLAANDLARPWPARHVIAVSEAAIGRGVVRDLKVRSVG